MTQARQGNLQTKAGSFFDFLLHYFRCHKILNSDVVMQLSTAAGKRVGLLLNALLRGVRCNHEATLTSLCTIQVRQHSASAQSTNTTRLHSNFLSSSATRTSLPSVRSLCSHGNSKGISGSESSDGGAEVGARSDNEPRVPFYDIVIVGGGMTGRAMACALGLEASLDPYKILMVEGASQPKPLPEDLSDSEYSNRVCALSQGSVDLLSSIGAWSHMVIHRVQPVRSMQVWDACSDAAISFRSEPEAGQDLAFIVENDVTVDALSRQLEKLGSRVKMMYNNSVKEIKVPDQTLSDQESWVKVELASGKILKTRILIGADGSNSVIRRLCDIPYVHWQYDQSAVVATLRLSEPTENVVAWQRFLPTGPIAMLPLTNEMSSLVWSTSHSQAESLMHMNEEQFVDEVNDAFWDDSRKDQIATSAGQFMNSVLSLVRPDGSGVRQLPPSVSSISPASRAMFPLSLGHASHYVKPRIALIGDAAHRVHPMAGQGVNLGFGDVACLRDSLVSAASTGKDLGCLSHLLEYETSRQRAVIPVVAVIDGLKRLYSTDNPLAVLARSLGLQATNAMVPLKQQIITMATGR
ncbi:ubiquinone biosynthesis monooxygenase COQ6, mitochondrial-like [Patiria miniata]|uniref:Ubiquinone biosynthesis monooxygenase COQ6, mitochondrial n=1 Tax=Patiria miniata TaxID=46514 RepID=A0A914BA20_PATMI|nr:ubiquinone biosynthesis monooxygenase COQ6, mitochondrial-like [Patiria miniata]